MKSHVISISGSSGYIGRHLTKLCGSREVEFDVIKRDDSQAFNNIRRARLSTIIHLAGRAHIINETTQFPYHEFYKANCEYALKLARSAASEGLKRFVYVSRISY